MSIYPTIDLTEMAQPRQPDTELHGRGPAYLARQQAEADLCKKHLDDEREWSETEWLHFLDKRVGLISGTAHKYTKAVQHEAVQGIEAGAWVYFKKHFGGYNTIRYIPAVIRNAKLTPRRRVRLQMFNPDTGELFMSAVNIDKVMLTVEVTT